MEKEEFRKRLKRSMEAIGLLYPVLVDKHGEIIDGRERLLVDKTAPVQRVPWVDTPEKLVKSRLHANVIRKSRDELEEDMIEAAETLRGAGMKPGKIVPWLAGETGFDSSYVRRLLPSEFKAPEMVRRPPSRVPEEEEGVPSAPEEREEIPPPKRRFPPTEAMEYPSACPECGKDVLIRFWGRYRPRALELARRG